ncbi:MAG TPA: metal-dependent transcriptional regulator [Candidatus Kapabacteria bacterium]|nr:metal-dependent transcriptional regulator [Candidatus Kapabacteria bacterium]
MVKIEVNQTIEDYLRSMYRLESRDGKASNAALAKELAISSSAVTEMARRLADGGLVSYRKYQGLKLTKTGLGVAVGVTRRHRLWEVFLIQHLGFEWDEVHDLADQLEHIGSEELIDRLEKFLGYPTHDPHGDPIPNKKGEIAERELVLLAGLKPGERGVVARVSDEFPELLRYASSLGLSINAGVRIVERIAFDGSVRLIADGRESVVSDKLANSVYVEKEYLEKGKGHGTGRGRTGKR